MDNDNTSLTIAAYNKCVLAYEVKFMHYAPYQQQVSEFIDLLPSSVSVLDLGCGPGNTARQLLASGKVESFVGVDLSAEMIRSARQNTPDGKFVVQDLRDTNYRSQSFDVVVMSFCIVHLSNHEAESLICRAADWIKPCGWLYLSFMEGKQSGWETTSFSDAPLYFNYYEGERIAELIKNLGFSIRQLQRQGYPETDGSLTTDVFIIATKE